MLSIIFGIQVRIEVAKIAHDKYSKQN